MSAEGRLLRLEHLAARVATVGEVLNMVRVLFIAADLAIKQQPEDAGRFKSEVIEIVARELKLDVGELRAALLGVAAGH